MPEHDALGLNEQAVAPVERRVQGPLARRCGAVTWPEKREMLLEKLADLREAVDRNPPGRQFDREGNAVEPSADRGDQGGIRVRQGDPPASGRRPFQEQLNRGIPTGGSRRQCLVGRRIGQGREQDHMLAGDPKRLAACRQEANPARPGQDVRGEHRRRVDEVFAGIEDQEERPVPQMREQGGHRVFRRHGQV